MPIRAEADDRGVWRIAVHDEPSWVSVINSQSQDSLDSIVAGVWLYVAFSVWKVPDRVLLTETLRVVPQDGRVQVRIYGYDFATELDNLFPFKLIGYRDDPIVSLESDGKQSVLSIVGDSTASPIWMLFSDGRLTTSSQGVDGLRPIREQLKLLV